MTGVFETEREERCAGKELSVLESARVMHGGGRCVTGSLPLLIHIGQEAAATQRSPAPAIPAPAFWSGTLWSSPQWFGQQGSIPVSATLSEPPSSYTPKLQSGSAPVQPHPTSVRQESRAVLGIGLGCRIKGNMHRKAALGQGGSLPFVQKHVHRGYTLPVTKRFAGGSNSNSCRVTHQGIFLLKCSVTLARQIVLLEK